MKKKKQPRHYEIKIEPHTHWRGRENDSRKTYFDLLAVREELQQQQGTDHWLKITPHHCQG